MNHSFYLVKHGHTVTLSTFVKHGFPHGETHFREWHIKTADSGRDMSIPSLRKDLDILLATRYLSQHHHNTIVDSPIWTYRKLSLPACLTVFDPLSPGATPPFSTITQCLPTTRSLNAGMAWLQWYGLRPPSQSWMTVKGKSLWPGRQKPAEPDAGAIKLLRRADCTNCITANG